MQEMGLDEDVERGKHVCHGLDELYPHTHVFPDDRGWSRHQQ